MEATGKQEKLFTYNMYCALSQFKRILLCFNNGYNYLILGILVQRKCNTTTHKVIQQFHI